MNAEEEEDIWQAMVAAEAEREEEGIEEEDIEGEDIEEDEEMPLFEEDEEEDGDWEEDDESDHADNDDTGLAVHRNVNCDECGASPIRGVRYHSTRIIDYDICESCYTDNHKHLSLATAFHAITKPQNKSNNVDETQWFGKDCDQLAVDAVDFEDLWQELTTKPKLQALDASVHAGVQVADNARYQDIAKTIAHHQHLKSVYIQSAYFEEPEPYEEETHIAMMSCLCRGLSQNSSVITLSIILDFSLGPAMDVLCSMIRNSTSIRYLFVMNNPDRAQPADQTEDDYMAMERNRYQRSQRSVLDLCEALRHSTSLHSFVCQGVGALDEDCTRLALKALQTRPNLKRILAEFPTQDAEATTLEQELQTLMASKKTRWMQDWNALDATPASRVHLLEELRNCQQVDDQDRVAALFHFLRSNPGALPETVEDVPKSGSLTSQEISRDDSNALDGSQHRKRSRIAK